MKRSLDAERAAAREAERILGLSGSLLSSSLAVRAAREVEALVDQCLNIFLKCLSKLRASSASAVLVCCETVNVAHCRRLRAEAWSARSVSTRKEVARCSKVTRSEWRASNAAKADSKSLWSSILAACISFSLFARVASRHWSNACIPTSKSRAWARRCDSSSMERISIPLVRQVVKHLLAILYLTRARTCT